MFSRISPTPLAPPMYLNGHQSLVDFCSSWASPGHCTDDMLFKSAVGLHDTLCLQGVAVHEINCVITQLLQCFPQSVTLEKKITVPVLGCAFSKCQGVWRCIKSIIGQQAAELLFSSKLKWCIWHPPGHGFPNCDEHAVGDVQDLIGSGMVTTHLNIFHLYLPVFTFLWKCKSMKLHFSTEIFCQMVQGLVFYESFLGLVEITFRKWSAGITDTNNIDSNIVVRTLLGASVPWH